MQERSLFLEVYLSCVPSGYVSESGVPIILEHLTVRSNGFTVFSSFPRIQNARVFDGLEVGNIPCDQYATIQENWGVFVHLTFRLSSPSLLNRSRQLA